MTNLTTYSAGESFAVLTSNEAISALLLVASLFPSLGFVFHIPIESFRVPHRLATFQKIMSINGQFVTYLLDTQRNASNVWSEGVTSVFFHYADTKVHLPDYAKILILTSSYPTSSDLPNYVPETSTFLMVVLAEPNTLLQVLRPSPLLEPRIAELATFRNEGRKWVLLQYKPTPSRLRTDMLGMTFRLGISTTSEMKPDEAIHLFVDSMSALYWVLLTQHFHFRISLIRVLRPTALEVFAGDIKNIIAHAQKGNLDFIADLLLISSERVHKLKFVLVGLDYKFHFIVRRPEYTYSLMSFTRPLNLPAWLAFLAMIALASVFFYAIQASSPNMTRKMDLSTACVIIFGFSCSQANLEVIRSLSVQIVCISALFFFLIINQFYVSNLYSLLSSREFKYPFNTMEDFAELKTHKLLIHPDTSVYTAFQMSKGGILQRIYKNFIENDPNHVINNTNVVSAIGRVCSGTTAIFSLPLQVLQFQKYCPLMATPTGYFTNQMGLAASKNFTFMRHFQSFFIRATQSGISSNYLQAHINSKIVPVLEKPALSLEPLPISLDQVILIFALYFTLLAASVVFLLVEMAVCKCRSRSAVPSNNRKNGPPCARVATLHKEEFHIAYYN